MKNGKLRYLVPALLAELILCIICAHALIFDEAGLGSVIYNELRFLWLSLLVLAVLILFLLAILQKNEEARFRILSFLALVLALPIMEFLVMILRVYVFAHLFQLIFF